MTVAKALNKLSRDECRLTNIGAKLVIDATERSNEECGDGTTTSSLITGFILKEGSKLLMSQASVNPVELRKGIQMAVNVLCDELDRMAVKIQSTDDPLVKSVAMISSNSDTEIAELITEIHKRIGVDGTISI